MFLKDLKFPGHIPGYTVSKTQWLDSDIQIGNVVLKKGRDILLTCYDDGELGIISPGTEICIPEEELSHVVQDKILEILGVKEEKPTEVHEFKITDEELNSKLRRTVYLVEATEFEIAQLKKIYATSGLGSLKIFSLPEKRTITIGWVQDTYPINIEVSWWEVGTSLIMFYESVSDKVDYSMIRQWFEKVLPKVRRTNALNFINVIQYLEVQAV